MRKKASYRCLENKYCVATIHLSLHRSSRVTLPNGGRWLQHLHSILQGSSWASLQCKVESKSSLSRIYDKYLHTEYFFSARIKFTYGAGWQSHLWSILQGSSWVGLCSNTCFSLHRSSRGTLTNRGRWPLCVLQGGSWARLECAVERNGIFGGYLPHYNHW